MKTRLGLILLLPWLLQGCSNPPYPRGDITSLFPAEPRPEMRTATVSGRNLNVAAMPRSGGTPMFFVHGSPGDWKAWSRYLDAPALAERGPRIAVDRPGFGGSGAGEVVTQLRVQAAMLAAVIPPGPPAVLVGHSLGGPLVAWMALDHPDKVCGVVMVAGSVAPALEAPRWYNRFAASAFGRWLLPRELLWSNAEIMALQTELMELDAQWPQLQHPLVVVQGERDELVDPRSVDYLQQRVPAQQLRVVRVPDQGHMVLWDQPQMVIEAMLSLPCWI